MKLQNMLYFFLVIFSLNCQAMENSDDENPNGQQPSFSQQMIAQQQNSNSSSSSTFPDRQPGQPKDDNDDYFKMGDILGLSFIALLNSIFN